MFPSARSLLTALALNAALAFIAVATVFGAPAAAGQRDAPVADGQPDAITASATIDGHDVAAAATGQPLRLYPVRNIDATVVVTNHGQSPVEITGVQLVGRVVGLTFFSYTAIVDVTVAPGDTATVHYQLDLTDLKGQATGLLGGELIVRDSAHNAVAVVPTVTDVRGSLLSVYGVFGLALVVLTVLALADAAYALARHRLSTNRWRRGLRLMMPGIGIGLVLVFTASAARWWVPRTGLWLLVAGITAAAFFVLGYFSPTPERAHADDDTAIDERDLDLLIDHDATLVLGADHDTSVTTTVAEGTVAEGTVAENTVAEGTVAQGTEVEKTRDLQGEVPTDLKTAPPKEVGR